MPFADGVMVNGFILGLRRLPGVPKGDSAAVSRSANRMHQVWGSLAYARAAELSWRERKALGAWLRRRYWLRVQRELERRYGVKDLGPALLSHRRSSDLSALADAEKYPAC